MAARELSDVFDSDATLSIEVCHDLRVRPWAAGTNILSPKRAPSRAGNEYRHGPPPGEGTVEGLAKCGHQEIFWNQLPYGTPLVRGPEAGRFPGAALLSGAVVPPLVPGLLSTQLPS